MLLTHLLFIILLNYYPNKLLNLLSFSINFVVLKIEAYLNVTQPAVVYSINRISPTLLLDLKYTSYVISYEASPVRQYRMLECSCPKTNLIYNYSCSGCYKCSGAHDLERY